MIIVPKAVSLPHRALHSRAIVCGKPPAQLITNFNPKMTKQKILRSIPLAIIAGLLIYCWITILATDTLATWRHYVALGLFPVLILLYFKSFTLTVIGTGLYLLLATLNVLSITAEISAGWFRIGPVETPHVQLLSLGLLILFLILNFDTLINIYLDYKESKKHKN